MQLFHKDTFLNLDETKIDCIKESDEVKIIEVLFGVDFSCYDSYISKHENEEKINIVFIQPIRKDILYFTPNITIREMINIYFNKMNIPECQRKYFHFFCDSQELDINDDILKNKIKHPSEISSIRVYYWSNSHSLYGSEGKNIIALIYINGRQIGNRVFGTLELIKNVYKSLEISYLLDILKFKINGKEIQKDDDRTLSSMGIREDFTCDIELKEQK